MRILIVYAHPVDTSFVAAIFREVRDTLERVGHEIHALDLYEMGFDPVLSRDERLAYETRGPHRDGLAEHIEAIAWAEGLIFVYPTWWYGLPAVLKGWLDRVWLPEVSFSLPDGPGRVRPLMGNVRLLGGISTYGAGWWWTRYVGDPGRRTIMRGLGALCARNRRTFWLALHEMDSAVDAKRSAFLATVRNRVERL